MSKPDLRAHIDLSLDFIVQNVSTTTDQCHFTDGWGASSSDPKGQEGLQDCLLDRYQLCAQRAYWKNSEWFDYSVCLFRNQKETDSITDHMKKFEATVQYCSAVTGLDHMKLKHCAEGPQGAQLLSASHKVEVDLNPGRVGGKIKSVPPEWIAVEVGGKFKSVPSSADWLQAICDAYTS